MYYFDVYSLFPVLLYSQPKKDASYISLTIVTSYHENEIMIINMCWDASCLHSLFISIANIAMIIFNIL